MSLDSCPSCWSQRQENAPRLAKLFWCMYVNTEDDSHANDDSMSLQKGCLRHPSCRYTLHETFHRLGQGKGQGRLLHYPPFASDAKPVPDVAYASQLELFTRVFLGDVYSDLRGVSGLPCPIHTLYALAFRPFLAPNLLCSDCCFVGSRMRLVRPMSGMPSCINNVCLQYSYRSRATTNFFVCMPTFPMHALKWNGHPITPCSFRLLTRVLFWRRRKLCAANVASREELKKQITPLFWKGGLVPFVRPMPKSEVLAILLPMSGQSEGHCFLQ